MPARLALHQLNQIPSPHSSHLKIKWSGWRRERLRKERLTAPDKGNPAGLGVCQDACEDVTSAPLGILLETDTKRPLMLH